MQQLTILNSKEKKNISKLISEQFGCDFKFKYEVFMNPKNKIFILNKDVSKIDLDKLRVNSLGLYFGVKYENEIRLSIEGSEIIGKIAKKKVLELADAKGIEIQASIKSRTNFLYYQHQQDLYL